MASGSVNKVILVGNLGRDAELRATPGGLEVISFSVATTERKRDRETNQWTDQVEWHRVKMFRDTQKSRSTVHEYPEEGPEGLCRGPTADAQLGRQGRPEEVLDRDHLGPHRAARSQGRRIGRRRWPRSGRRRRRLPGRRRERRPAARSAGRRRAVLRRPLSDGAAARPARRVTAGTPTGGPRRGLRGPAARDHGYSSRRGRLSSSWRARRLDSEFGKSWMVVSNISRALSG